LWVQITVEVYSGRLFQFDGLVQPSPLGDGLVRAKVGEADTRFIHDRKRRLIGEFAKYRQDQLEDGRFTGLRVKYSTSRQIPFARLKVKVKPEIISFRRPGTTPEEARAPTVDPHTLARWLRQGRDDDGRRVVMLDTRNQQEIAYGTFAGALTLPIDKFTDLPAALEPHRDALKDATVVSFCTGGIRCEKAALWMQADGMDNVLQLDDGILGYFERVGGFGYDGACFVFDERVALRPDLTPLVDQAADAA